MVRTLRVRSKHLTRRPSLRGSSELPFPPAHLLSYHTVARSLYRWKTFWFGLFIILSLAWAWWDSHRYSSEIFWIGRGGLYSGAGDIGISLVIHPSPEPFEIRTTRMPLPEFIHASLLTHFENHSLPHWLLFESSVFLWFLLLGWRTRRHRRIEQSLTKM